MCASLARRLAVLALLLAPLACKQGVGERCQITSDCESGLVCGTSPSGGRVCREEGSQTVIDAPPPMVADAAIDGFSIFDAPQADAADPPDAEEPTPDADETPDAI